MKQKSEAKDRYKSGRHIEQLQLGEKQTAVEDNWEAKVNIGSECKAEMKKNIDNTTSGNEVEIRMHENVLSEVKENGELDVMNKQIENETLENEGAMQFDKELEERTEEISNCFEGNTAAVGKKSITKYDNHVTNSGGEPERREYSEGNEMVKNIAEISLEEVKKNERKTIDKPSIADPEKKDKIAINGKDIENSKIPDLEVIHDCDSTPGHVCQYYSPLNIDIEKEAFNSISEKEPYKRPHRCMQCDAAFRTPYELARHSRIHSGERPFKCQWCSMSFKRKDHVEVHMRRHVEDRRHVCDICGVWFVTSSCLLRHIRRTHHIYEENNPGNPKNSKEEPSGDPSDTSTTTSNTTTTTTTPENKENNDILAGDKEAMGKQDQQKKGRRPRSRKSDSTYRPGGRTVCVIKKRKLRHRSYSFAELEDDIECFESDEEDKIPYLRIQEHKIQKVEERQEPVVQVNEVENSVFPFNVLSQTTLLEQLLFLQGVNNIVAQSLNFQPLLNPPQDDLNVGTSMQTEYYFIPETQEKCNLMHETPNAVPQDNVNQISKDSDINAILNKTAIASGAMVINEEYGGKCDDDDPDFTYVACDVSFEEIEGETLSPVDHYLPDKVNMESSGDGTSASNDNCDNSGKGIIVEFQHNAKNTTNTFSGQDSSIVKETADKNTNTIVDSDLYDNLKYEGKAHINSKYVVEKFSFLHTEHENVNEDVSSGCSNDKSCQTEGLKLHASTTSFHLKFCDRIKNEIEATDNKGNCTNENGKCDKEVPKNDTYSSNCNDSIKLKDNNCTGDVNLKTETKEGLAEEKVNSKSELSEDDCDISIPEELVSSIKGEKFNCKSVDLQSHSPVQKTNGELCDCGGYEGKDGIINVKKENESVMNIKEEINLHDDVKDEKDSLVCVKEEKTVFFNVKKEERNVKKEDDLVNVKKENDGLIKVKQENGMARKGNILKIKEEKGNDINVKEEVQGKKAQNIKRPHQCRVCGRHFCLPSELARHQRTHSGERRFQCELCGSSFLRKCHLDLHVRRHTGERRHVCKECGMKFFTTSDLNRHSLIHKTIKPFSCHLCDLTFRQVTQLEQHVLQHEMTHFPCKLCGTFFTSATSLKKHEKCHPSTDPLSCTDCNACFSTATLLSKHKCVHSDSHYNFIKSMKFHINNMKKNQYECISSEESPLSLVIRKVAERRGLKIPEMLESSVDVVASELCDSSDQCLSFSDTELKPENYSKINVPESSIINTDDTSIKSPQAALPVSSEKRNLKSLDLPKKVNKIDQGTFLKKKRNIERILNIVARADYPSQYSSLEMIMRGAADRQEGTATHIVEEQQSTNSVSGPSLICKPD